MVVFRKIVGGVILLMMALPALIGVIWATGVASSVFREEFWTSVPQAAMAELPQLADDLFLLAGEPGAMADEQARQWAAAAAQAGFKPSEFMRKIGLSDWMEKDLAATLAQVSQVLRGELEPGAVALDFRRLKAALAAPEVRTVMQAVVDRLPPCDELQRHRWAAVVLDPDRHRRLPACRPDQEIAGRPAEALLEAMVHLPDEVRPLERTTIPQRMDLLSLVRKLLWTLFIVPVILLLLGGAVAGTSPASFLRWTGGTALAGGLLPLLFAVAAQTALAGAVLAASGDWAGETGSSLWSSQVSQQVAVRMAGLAERMMAGLFEPVTTIGGIVAGIGLVMVAGSFLARGASKPSTSAT